MKNPLCFILLGYKNKTMAPAPTGPSPVYIFFGWVFANRLSCFSPRNFLPSSHANRRNQSVPHFRKYTKFSIIE